MKGYATIKKKEIDPHNSQDQTPELLIKWKSMSQNNVCTMLSFVINEVYVYIYEWKKDKKLHPRLFLLRKSIAWVTMVQDFFLHWWCPWFSVTPL